MDGIAKCFFTFSLEKRDYERGSESGEGKGVLLCARVQVVTNGKENKMNNNKKRKATNGEPLLKEENKADLVKTQWFLARPGVPGSALGISGSAKNSSSNDYSWSLRVKQLSRKLWTLR